MSSKNRRFTSFERAPGGGGLCLKTGSKRRLFFSACLPRLSKLCKISVETEIVPISLPLIRIGFSTQSVYETRESSNCDSKKIRYTTDSLLRQYSTNCEVSKRTDYTFPSPFLGCSVFTGYLLKLG